MYETLEGQVKGTLNKTIFGRQCFRHFKGEKSFESSEGIWYKLSG